MRTFIICVVVVVVAVIVAFVVVVFICFPLLWLLPCGYFDQPYFSLFIAFFTVLRTGFQ